MANTTAQDQNTTSATGDYSATKAPENREHVTSRAQSGDPKLTPGGPHGAPVDVGMGAIDADYVADEVKAVNDDRRGTGKQ
jgi:hypothetical protein